MFSIRFIALIDMSRSHEERGSAAWHSSDRAGFPRGQMTGAGRRPNRIDFLALDRRGGTSARLGDQPGRRHSGSHRGWA